MRIASFDGLRGLSSRGLMALLLCICLQWTVARDDVGWLRAWQALLASGAQTEAEKLLRVNAYINQAVRFASDETVWRQPDYWATPAETLQRGAGDCEDFSIAKYISLRRLGVAEEKLRLIYVKAQRGEAASQAHMVLGYYAGPGSEPLILDNLTPDILPASRRADLIPVFSFNSEGLWAGGVRASRTPAARLSRWRDLLARLDDPLPL